MPRLIEVIAMNVLIFIASISTKLFNTVYHYHGAPVKYVTIFSDKYFTGALKNLYYVVMSI